MGKIDYFNILFEKKAPIYFAGEILTGQIQISVIERIKISSLFVCFDGETNVHWLKNKIFIYYIIIFYFSL